jgi:hypothetical protein
MATWYHQKVLSIYNTKYLSESSVVTIARNGYLEVSVYFLKAKQGYKILLERRKKISAYTTTIIKFRIFLDIALCSHVEVNQRLRDAYCLHHQGNDGGTALMMGAVKHF